MAMSDQDMQKYLSDMQYPANKYELIEYARSKGADEDIISELENLPEDMNYKSEDDVKRAMENVMGAGSDEDMDM